MGYTYTAGTTSIEFFDWDMHTYSIRADKIINDYKDLKDVTERFEKDHSQFDYYDYFNRSTFHKASRDYTVSVRKRVDFELLIFEYEGREYSIKTRKYSTIRNIRNNAKIKEHKQLQTMCLVDDATGDILGEGVVLGSIDLLLVEELF